MISTFPAWNNQGIIPPIPADPKLATALPRSPYVVSLAEVVHRFSTTSTRIAILRGFLEYRSALHSAGVTRGFQWLDGSFLENKEGMIGQDPGDIDVATFFYLPPNVTQMELFARDTLVFGPDRVARKQRFKVDAFLIPLEAPTEIPVEDLVWNAHYWSGVFSHSRRQFLWKGFLQVDISSGEDAFAATTLANAGGATQ